MPETKDIWMDKLPPALEKRRTAALKWVEENKAELDAKSRRYRRELELMGNAMKMLAAERRRRGMSLAEVAAASGIDKSRLSKLENNPQPNPTMQTLLRIARALGVELTIGMTAPAKAA